MPRRHAHDDDTCSTNLDKLKVIAFNVPTTGHVDPSLTTVSNDNPAFFRQCIEAFNGSPYQVIISLGKRLSIEALGKIPANFIIRPYVLQLAILERSDLFITHDGVNSVHQALYHGVPLLLVPQQLEQALVAARLAELGAGLVQRKPSATRLRATADRLLKDGSYRQRANALGEDLRAAGGVGRAAVAIEALVDAAPEE